MKKISRVCSYSFMFFLCRWYVQKYEHAWLKTDLTEFLYESSYPYIDRYSNPSQKSLVVSPCLSALLYWGDLCLLLWKRTYYRVRKIISVNSVDTMKNKKEWESELIILKIRLLISGFLIFWNWELSADYWLIWNYNMKIR